MHYGRLAKYIIARSRPRELALGHPQGTFDDAPESEEEHEQLGRLDERAAEPRMFGGVEQQPDPESHQHDTAGEARPWRPREAQDDEGREEREDQKP